MFAMACTEAQLTMSTNNDDGDGVPLVVEDVLYSSRCQTTFSEDFSHSPPNSNSDLPLTVDMHEKGSILKKLNDSDTELNAVAELVSEADTGCPNLTNQEIKFSDGGTLLIRSFQKNDLPPGVQSIETSQNQNSEIPESGNNWESENLMIQDFLECSLTSYDETSRGGEEKIWSGETGLLPFTCGDCGQKFATYLQAVNHLRISKIQGHVKRYFMWDPSLHNFKDMNHPPSRITDRRFRKKAFFPCAECSIGFSRCTDWETHLNETHPGTLQKYLVCPIFECRKTFASWVGLKLHVNIHRQDKKKSPSVSHDPINVSDESASTKQLLETQTGQTLGSVGGLEIAIEEGDLNRRVKTETEETILPDSGDQGVWPNWQSISDTTITYDFATGEKMGGVAELPVPRIASAAGWTQLPEEPEIGITSVTCNGCSKQFSNFSALKSHLTSHLNPLCRDRTYTWDPRFDDKFQNLDLTTEMTLENFEAARNVCVACRIGFLREFKLKAHLQDIHGEGRTEIEKSPDIQSMGTAELNLIPAKLEKPANPSQNLNKCLPCDLCDSTFSSHKKLKFHKQIFHCRDKGPYKCKECGLQFSLLVEILNHARLHAGKELHTCEICGISFFKPGVLRNHRHKVHGIELEPFRCEVCKKTFITPYNLKNHMYSHREKPIVVCEICSAEFPNRSRLYFHMKIHTPQFNCEKCGRRFDNLSQVQIHIDRVHKVKSFVCEQCKRTFTTRSGLTNHVTNDHLQCDESLNFPAYLSVEKVEIKPEIMFEKEFVEVDDFQSFQFEFTGR